MSGFESLDTAVQPVPASTLEADKVAWRGEDMDDDTAVQLVLGDVQRAEAFVQSKNMTVQWERADNNFRAAGLPKNWPGVESQRAGLAVPLVMEVTEKLLSVVFLAFFSDKQPFLLEGIGNVKGDALRAKEKLLLWAVQLSGFKEEIRKMLKSCLLYGFGIGRWGWKTTKRQSKTYQMDQQNPGKVKPLVKDYEIAHPTFEQVEVRHFLGDPSLREQDARKGRYNVVQIFVDAYDLDALRDDPGYKNIPTRDELAKLLAYSQARGTDSMIGAKYMTWRDYQAAKETDSQSADPLKTPLEILEYVTEDRIITVLQRCICIRNEATEFGRSTFVSSAFIDVPGSMYGFGVSTLNAGEQYLQTSILNAGLDVLALQCQPFFTAAQGLQTTGQNVKIGPGKILTGVELKAVQVPSVSSEVENAVQLSENRATRRVGANTADNMPTQALRTAQGVNAFTEGATDKIQYFIEQFAELVFVPVLEAFLDLCHDKLQPADIQNILYEIDGKAYQGDVTDIYNTRCRIQVLSSTKLAARRAAAQLIPMLLQLVTAQPVQDSLAAQGKKFDYAELIEEAIDLAGWDCGALIVPATQQDIQRAMMMSNPQMVKAQSDAQQQQQQQQDALQQIEETGLMRAGVNIISHSVKAANAAEGGELI
jgi:hypothetical protein